jgi:hypothetical protein
VETAISYEKREMINGALDHNKVAIEKEGEIESAPDGMKIDTKNNEQCPNISNGSQLSSRCT